ncbi:MAG TPA: DUF2059 domain-containing protein, partial [Bradyrhizobium sp.]
ELQNELLKGEDDLMAVSACIYAQHYTGDELRQLKAFYGTPLGQKLISEGPAVLKDSIAVGQAWGRRAGLAAVQHVLARHKKDGDKT